MGAVDFLFNYFNRLISEPSSSLSAFDRFMQPTVLLSPSSIIGIILYYIGRRKNIQKYRSQGLHFISLHLSFIISLSIMEVMVPFNGGDFLLWIIIWGVIFLMVGHCSDILIKKGIL